MNDREIIDSLDAAIRIICKARSSLANGSTVIWTISKHAEEHLDKQIKALIREAA